MSSPKKPSSEQAATLIATTLPGFANSTPQSQPQGAPDRRTAALPQVSVPTSAPHDRTMTFDPQQLHEAHQALLRGPRPEMHTVVTSQPMAPSAGPALPSTSSTPSPPPRPRGLPRPIARWFLGPLLAAVMGIVTMGVAGLIAAAQPHVNTRGTLRISSDPEGATVILEGKVFPHATPTVIEGEIGATLRVGFKLDGYLDNEAEVFVGEGERPFRVKLERRDAQPPKPVATDEPDMATPISPRSLAPDRPRTKKDPSSHRTSSQTTVAPLMGGSGTLSVRVRPWAIVYIDGAKIRQTPVSGHTLTAGLHSVELVNEELKKKEKVTVEVRANGHEEIQRDWE